MACRMGEAEDELFIIQYLPLHLAKSARVWIEHLLVGYINSWSDLRRVFVGNFQGTFVRPGNS
jgi:hypothetical protein